MTKNGTFAAAAAILAAAFLGAVSPLSAQLTDWPGLDPAGGARALIDGARNQAAQRAFPIAARGATLPSGRLDALPQIFTVPVAAERWTYPGDGVESSRLTLEWLDCA